MAVRGRTMAAREIVIKYLGVRNAINTQERKARVARFAAMFLGPFVVAVSAFGVASVVLDGGALTSDTVLVLTTFALCYLCWIFCIIFAEARLTDAIEADVASLRVRRLLLWSDYARGPPPAAAAASPTDGQQPGGVDGDGQVEEKKEESGPPRHFLHQQFDLVDKRDARACKGDREIIRELVAMQTERPAGFKAFGKPVDMLLVSRFAYIILYLSGIVVATSLRGR